MAIEVQMSAAERCYRILSKKIVSLELKPNEPVGEHMLAESLGVSRTPVREALSRLGAEQLVDLRARSGGVVSPIRLEAVGAAQFVREQLEVAIVAEAAKASNKRIMLTLKQAIEEQQLAIAEANPELFFKADERMHFLLCSMAGRERVWRIISDNKKHMDRVRRISLQNGHLDELLQDHIDLIDAVGAGNVSLAQNLMRNHLRRVLTHIEEYVVRFPEYFDPGQDSAPRSDPDLSQFL